MPDTTPGSPMAKWWIAIAITALVFVGIVYFATRHSQRVDANAVANGTGRGGAYDATTGNVVPAAATPGSLRVGAPNNLGEGTNAAENTSG